MTERESSLIRPGTVVEFFESKEILCGVCLSVKNHRLHVLTEQNREVNLSESRIIHVTSTPLDLELPRDELVRRLAAIAAARGQLMGEIDLEELWSLVEGEQGGFSAEDLAGFVFSGALTPHHVAAMQRRLFQERLHFLFKEGSFYALDRDKVEERIQDLAREKERESRLEKGSEWLQGVWNRKQRTPPDQSDMRLVEELKDYCLHGQDSPHYPFIKELFRRAGIPPQPQSAFRLLVRLGVWHENENLYLHEHGITADFPEPIEALAATLAETRRTLDWDKAGRRDLRGLPAFTIDNPMSRDFDDAITVHPLGGDLYEVGIHIADVAEFVPPQTPLDREAEARASSIYLPDGRITMFPACLSEDLFSLRAGCDRPALSFLIQVDSSGGVHRQEIVPTVVKVHQQMTYSEVNDSLERHPHLQLLHQLALVLRKRRLENGAVILPLPEINVSVNPMGMIQVVRYEKETPSQIIVSEWMIAANALAAAYLADRSLPAVFRSQAECKPERDFFQSDHELFHIYRQRRLFARAELDTRPHAHCSLGLPQYTMVTSPIRRYSDLVVQRQIKHALTSGNALYSDEELQQLITRLGAAQAVIFQVQRKWTRYWILKYLEQEDIRTIDALVLNHNSRFAHLLLPDFLLETNVPVTDREQVRPGELIRVKIDKVNPREDLLKVLLPELPK